MEIGKIGHQLLTGTQTEYFFCKRLYQVRAIAEAVSRWFPTAPARANNGTDKTHGVKLSIRA
jgi:hypothetical protein